ncbi:MAG: hypothetical protein D6760_11895 [Deltaproteobacteria bacterium]|nr:MAG: hypothetical protein D6760_11895 [Deltaproteobacteria bacterium]
MELPSGFRIALFAALVVAGAWASYWPRIKAHRVPRRPIVHQAAMAAGICLAILGLVRGPGTLGVVLAVFAVIGAIFFLFSSLTSAVPQKRPAVEVGGRVLPFEATDSEGARFDLGSLAGRPILLKFFRGFW